MPRSDEHAYEELIRESERILRDMVAPGAAGKQTASDAALAITGYSTSCPADPQQLLWYALTGLVPKNIFEE